MPPGNNDGCGHSVGSAKARRLVYLPTIVCGLDKKHDEEVREEARFPLALVGFNWGGSARLCK